MNLGQLFLLGLVATLSACGFQLRGFGHLPDRISQIELVADNFTSRQRQQLQEQLRRAGATIHNADSGAVRLAVSIQSLPEQKLVDNGDSGQSIIQLSRQLNYSLIDASGERLVDNKVLHARSNLQIDDSSLLNDESEKQLAEQALDNQLLRNLMIQLQRF